ncbi:MAG TPA: aminopeptidase N [Egibacteraceae bacterium]|nr:aminopeptidase N [Egibacteraceae bacterium]
MPETHPNLTRDEARQRARLLSDVVYTVDLDVTGDGDTFGSRTVVRFDCTEPGASTFVDLVAPAVRRITLNGRDVGPAAHRDHRIALEGLAASNELIVEADCAYMRTGVGLHRFADPVDGKVYLHTQFEPFDAHRVFACFDQPDLKAPLELSVRAPAEWLCVSNTAAVEQPPRGQAGVWRFAPTLPISPYIYALVAGPYHQVHDRWDGGGGEPVDLGIYCRASLAPHLDAEEIFTITKQSFAFFTETFGYPYPFGQGGGHPGPSKKYDQLFVPEFNFGAMENPGCVTFSESYLFRSKVTDAARESRAGTITHEMAHMWFGDLVTMRWWDDLWLNESFATYIGTLAVAESTRFTEAWSEFCNQLKAWAYREDQLPSTHPIVADITDTEAVRTHFDGITYAKGASVLKQLVAWVGREGFVEGLRDYFRRHAFGNTTLEDFLGALDRASGRELSDWSKLWLETAGVNTIRPEIRADDGVYGEVALLQEAPERWPTLRPHRIALGLYDRQGGKLVRRERVELDVEGSRTVVPELAGRRVPDLLLINDDDLAYTKVRLDERSLRTVEEHLDELPGSLPRALVWGAAWDMTRDGELATRRFVRLVARHVGAESNVGVLQVLLRHASTATDAYGRPDNRHAMHALLADVARRELERAEPGSDFQLQWARTLADNCVRPEDQAFLLALLSGAESIRGLDIDTELRWHFLVDLASEGAADEGAIAAELERDPTDIGQRRAATARAARPDADAKKEAWAALVERRDVSLARMRALVGGFHQVGQDALLRPYVQRYVDALPGIWSTRGPEEALLLTEGLFPGALVEPATVEAAERALALGLPAPARRILEESQDGVRRALRAREADTETGARARA